MQLNKTTAIFQYSLWGTCVQAQNNQITERKVSTLTEHLIQTRCQLFRDTLQDRFAVDQPLALVDFQDTINCGDLLIWLGEKKYLHELGVKPDYECSLESYNAELMRNCIGDGPILMSGGGSFGDLYIYQAFREQILSDFPDNEVLIFPQSVNFLNDERLQASAQRFRDHGKVTICARDDASYALLQKHFSFCTLLKVPDAANFLGPQPPLNQPVADVLWICRTDKESCFNQGQGIRERFTEPEKTLLLPVSTPLENGVSLKVSVARNVLLTDWCQVSLNNQQVLQHYQALSFEQKAKAQLEWAKAILCLGRVVITDRLHGHILSTLMDIPHVILDNNYRKVSGYMDSWLPRPSNALCADNPEQAMAMAQDLLT